MTRKSVANSILFVSILTWHLLFLLLILALLFDGPSRVPNNHYIPKEVEELTEEELKERAAFALLFL
jgi:hypothetical protein